VKKMFILEDQEKQYRAYLSQNIDAAYDPKSSKSIESRVEVIQGSQQANAELLMESPGDQVTYAAAKEEAARYVEFLLKEKEAVGTMLKLENSDLDIAHHGVAVSTLSVAIANKIGLRDPMATQTLALGALLHDLGHAHLERKALAPLSSLSEEEKLEYMAHPAEGGAKVQDKRHFDKSVISIIAQHEELIDGSGYPHQLREKVTDPLAVIVSTANDFDRFVLTYGLSHQEGVKKFMLDRIGLHPLDQVKALAQIA
jgi:putative nucleotidyltransferase with HDIG domain